MNSDVIPGDTIKPKSQPMSSWGNAWETAPRLDHLQNRRYAAVRFFRNWIVSHFSRCITAVLTWEGREVSRIGYSTWLCLIYFDSYAI